MESTNNFIYDCCSNDTFSNNSVNSDVDTNDTINKDSDLLSDFLEILNEYDNNNLNNDIDNENNSIIDNEKRIKEEKKEYWRQYHLNYYHKNRTYKIECEHCKKNVEKCSMRRHLKSNKCTKIREINNNNDKNDNNITIV